MRRYTLNCKGDLRMIEKPVVMGILNVTPDSFYEKSRVLLVDHALAAAEKMIQEGAYILDIGGQSSRPGSTMISTQEEINRVLPIIHAVHSRFPETLISIDTCVAEVARLAIENGASIVNDISGGQIDDTMISTVAALKVPYICMHLKGDFSNMHEQNTYDNMVEDIIDYFIERIHTCQQAGIKDVILDPGFGFSKNIEQNYTLLSKIKAFEILQKPMLVGISRKSMIYKELNINSDQSLNGTTALNMYALMNGASILRVHDVKEAQETIQLFNRLYSV